MFSAGEIIVILTAGAVLFGPKDLPKIGRMLGNLTGQAAGTLFAARARFAEFASHSELTDLHREVQESLHQLGRIRSELRGGINVLNPGPITQRVLQITPGPGAEAKASAAAGPSSSSAQGAGAALPGASGAAFSAQAAASDAAAAAWSRPTAQASPQWTAQPVAPPSSAAPTRQVFQHAAGGRQQGVSGNSSSGSSGSASPALHPPPLPLSAVAAGLAPDRSGTVPTGSDVMLDALAEQRVARRAAAFFQSMAAGGPSAGGGGGGMSGVSGMSGGGGSGGGVPESRVSCSTANSVVGGSVGAGLRDAPAVDSCAGSGGGASGTGGLPADVSPEKQTDGSPFVPAADSRHDKP